ncbi:YIP1 family protein [Fundicoccus culcitae]|uniref:YIP1 family protein n=1 Tax=Fundicoccus culcitae TaxID=2969821 RepID=A0ABY5P8R6_9LACT|nr:YIP1 family protein [Fundicoccus culcitae]UUX34990.1 YIP1 family protein [Fundicoccus culcitae]
MQKISPWLMVLVVAITALVNPLTINAQSTSRTYSLSADNQLIQVQDAYAPVDVITNEALQLPEDMVIANDLLYIIDSRARQVIILEKDGTLVNQFGQDVFMTPTGIALDQASNIYVADGIAQRVFKFDPQGNLLQAFERPTSPLFGAKTPFSPVKLHVDVRGNLYIVGEGSTNGLIQLNAAGEFLGFFGANSVATGLIQTLRDIFLTDTMNARVFSNLPPAPTNVTMDAEGAVYTVTSALTNESIKKLNIAGENMLDNLYNPVNPIDVTVGPQNRFYVLTSEGIISEFTRYGVLLFNFGSQDTTTQRLGIFIRPTAIEVDDDGILYVLDAEGGVIQRFSATAFAREIHAGLALYEDGRYQESATYWQEVLNLNPSFVFARNGMGDALFTEQRFEEARDHYQLGKAYYGYSQAYWEIRNDWLQSYAFVVVAIIIAFFVFRWLYRRFVKKPTKATKLEGASSNYDFLNPEPTSNLKMDLRSLRTVLTRPVDVFYEITIGRIGSIPTAMLIYGLLIAIFVLYNYFTGFLFNPQLTDSLNILFIIMLLIFAVGLFISMNYLVSTITDGEGTVKQLIIGTAYAFSPFLMGGIPLIIMSNIFTYNEAFVYELFLLILVLYTLFLLFMMIKEIHNYTFWETVRNIVVTLFLIFVFLIVAYVIYLLLMQIYDFVDSIIREVSLRV